MVIGTTFINNNFPSPIFYFKNAGYLRLLVTKCKKVNFLSRKIKKSDKYSDYSLTRLRYWIVG